MKQIIILAFGLLGSQGMQGQSMSGSPMLNQSKAISHLNFYEDAGQVNENEGSHETIRPFIAPELGGGKLTWMEYLRVNLQYPSNAWLNGMEGKTVIRFTVGTDGKVSESSVKIIRRAGWGFDEEVIRVLLGMSWNPAMKAGTPVAVNYTLPVTFRMNGYFFE